jgi:2-dehydro-3-deoxygluconokinase
LTVRRTAPDVVTLGECVIALVAEDHGPLVDVDRLRRLVAGAEANVIVGLARLGHQVAFIGRVGADPFGETIVRRLRGEGVDVSAVVFDPDASTGLLIRERRAIGPSEVMYYRAGSAGSRLDPSDVDAAAERGLFNASWLHVTGITAALSASARLAVGRAIQLARANGAIVSLDINLRRKLWTDAEARPILRDLAAQVDVLLGDEDELSVLLGHSPEGGPDALAHAALQLGPSTAVVKLGERGSFGIASDEEPVLVSGLRVDVVDPVGAGDAFAAGFIAARLRKLDLATSLLWGNACGASCVAAVGDLTGLPTLDELGRLLEPSSDRAIR